MDFTKRKKKGSSLLIVIAIMATVSIITISVLTMTTSGYKMRKDSNKRVETFYGADSGLEISERVLINFVEAAIRYGNSEVDNYISAVPENTVNMDTKNKEFKKAFVNFFSKGGESVKKPFYDEVAITYGTPTTYVYKELAEEIKKEAYYSAVKRENVDIYESNVSYKDKSNADVVLNDANQLDVTSIDLGVKSKYVDVADGKERAVSVGFDIEVPDYGKEIVKSKGATAPHIFDFVIGADGDFNFNFNSSGEIHGDLWVKGNSASRNVLTPRNKYEGGITVTADQQGANLKLNGSLITLATLKFEDMAVIAEKRPVGALDKNWKDRNIYANNVLFENTDYKEKVGTKEKVNNIDISGSDMYVYNDLVLNGDNNTMSVNSLYLLNDINQDKYDEYALDEGEVSSSIIVNTNSETGYSTKVTVGGDAYIMGTSYVDMGEGTPFQTGQSISVNKITKPYTFIGDEESNRYIYDYNGKLHLISELKEADVDGSTDISVEEKADLFVNYDFTATEKALATVLDVTHDEKLYNTGAILEGGNIKPPRLPNAKTMGTLKDKQIDYVREAFFMGAEGLYNVNDFWSKDEHLSVMDSFKWENFNEVIDKLDTTKINVLGSGTNGDVVAFELKDTVKNIRDKAKVDVENPALNAYESADLDGYKPQIIMSSSDKEIIIKEHESFSGANKIEENDTTITYNFEVGTGNAKKAPLLIIAKGSITINPVNDKNYTMMLSASDANYLVGYGTGAIIGSYNSPSSPDRVPGYAGNQFNFINELFKYILEDGDIMGEIGEGIFGGTESKEVIESIDVSGIIKEKNWELIK